MDSKTSKRLAPFGTLRKKLCKSLNLWGLKGAGGRHENLNELRLTTQIEYNRVWERLIPTRPEILKLVNTGWTHKQIAEAYDCGRSTITSIISRG